MAKVIYISGGQRSGKSSFAQKLALKLSSNPCYLATARIWDEDFKKRVKRHQADRDEQWQNFEEEKFLSQVQFSRGDVVVVDCITLWLTNFLLTRKTILSKLWSRHKKNGMLLLIKKNLL